MPECYLTIDDSPSPHTDAMVDYLSEMKIPALFFCRGDFLKANPQPIINAIQRGFVVGNHSFAHSPFGELSYEEAVSDITQADQLIDDVYDKAAVKRPGKYFRFPYLDRGDGDRIERHFEKASAININADPRVQALQDYLHAQGFTQPFAAIDHPLYTNQSIAGAADSLMTFTSFDWMLNDRHKGRWQYKNAEDLIARIDQTSDFSNHRRHVMIYHDQPGLLPTFKSLIDHMTLKGYEFLKF